MWKEPKFDSWKLYHPGGIDCSASDGTTHSKHGCPATGNPAHERSPKSRRAELLAGLPDTPGKRAECEMRKRPKFSSPTIPAMLIGTVGQSKMWRGAAVTEGTVTLPDIASTCSKTDCPGPHTERCFCNHATCTALHRYHTRVYPARVYTLGGAVAKVRADHR